MILKNKVINFLGDSITQGIGTTPGNIYHEIIAKNYGLKAANNYGISGTRFARQQNPTEENPSFDEYFMLRAEKMPEDVDAVVVFGGTNDFGHGDAPLGEFSDRTPDTFYGATHLLCQFLINKYHGKPIVFMTPLHRCTEDCLTGDNKPEPVANLETYVNIIKEVTRYYSLPVCDMFAISGLQPNVDVIKKNYIPDGLHPNEAGHKVIAERLANFLLSL